MNAPLAWVALGVIVGAYVFLWWALPLWMLGVLLLIALTFVNLQRRAVRPICLAVFGGVLAQTCLVLQPETKVLSSRVTGEVISTTGRYASLRTQTGTLRGYFYPKPPPEGSWITGQTKPYIAPPVLPGAWFSQAQSKLAKSPTVRWVHWAVLNPTPPTITVSKNLEHPDILLALGTGDRTQISSDTLSLLRRTGVVHLLAISGLHVGVVASFGALLGWLVSRRFTRGKTIFMARLIPITAAILAAASYGQLVGWPVSTQRAFWMLGLASATQLIGRTIRPWQILGAAVIAVFVADPSQVASLGFLMSFSAVAALIGWMPIWSALLKPDSPRWLRWTHNAFGTTVCASFGTLPVCAWVFQHLAIVSPIANLFAVPLFAALAVPCTLVGLFGPVETSDLLLNLADRSVDLAIGWVTLWDVDGLTPAVNWAGALLLWGAIFCFKRPIIALFLIIVAFGPRGWPTDTLELHFPAVGQGSACLVQWPDGRNWLIDGGPPGNAVLRWLRRQGIRKLDRVFVSHPDSDHLGGLLPVTESLQVGEMWVSRPPLQHETLFLRLVTTAQTAGIPLHYWDAEKVGEGSDNDSGLVVTIRHGSHRILLLGDIGKETESRLATHMPTMTAVQIAHHGSKTSSHPQLIKRSQATWAFIQVGKGNRYGHPAASVLANWSSQKLLRTDIDGSIHLETDGRNLDLKTWSPERLWKSVDE